MAVLALVVLASGVFAVPLTEPATIVVAPDRLAVTTFFNGAEMKISGSAPEDLKLAVLLTGPRGPVELKRKGKVWGLLWMNVGEVGFDEVPSAYLLATAEPIGELAPRAVRRQHGIGLDVLAALPRGESADDSTRLFAELVKLKQREQLYGSFEGSLVTRREGEGTIAFSTTLRVPARIPEASYRVALWGFRGDLAEVLAEAEVTVEEVGATHAIATFAHNHGTLYGVVALLIAVFVGLATGLVFGLATKGGH